MATQNPSVFMFGMPRSGTSALSEAISIHEDFAWISNIVKSVPLVPQLSFLNRATDLPFVGQVMRGKKQQRSGVFDFLRRALPHSDEAYTVWNRICREDFSESYLAGVSCTPEEKKRVDAYFKTLFAAHGRSRLFSKFTGPPRIHYLNSLFPGSIFIHVTRDPRAVVNSLLNVGFWKERGGLERPWWKHGFGEELVKEWESYEKAPEALAAIQWRHVTELAAIEEQNLEEGQVIHVRYEDFVEQPHTMLSDVFATLGMADSQRAHAYLDSVGKLRNMNFKYTEQLSAAQIARIEEITRKVAQSFGYAM